MTYSPVMIIHIAAGLIAVLAGSAALVVRKGSPLHRRTGDVFVVSMLLMAAGGAFMALMKSQRFNVFAGTLTFYLVATGALTMMRKPKETGRAEVALLFVALAAGVTSWTFAVQATSRSSTNAYFIFGLIALLSAAGDIRMFIRGGVAGAQRLVRHLWRMCFSLFVAAGSLFLGTASDPVMKKSGLRATIFSPAIRKTHLPEVPVIIIVVISLFWLFRVLFTKTYKKPPAVIQEVL